MLLFLELQVPRIDIHVPHQSLFVGEMNIGIFRELPQKLSDFARFMDIRVGHQFAQTVDRSHEIHMLVIDFVDARHVVLIPAKRVHMLSRYADGAALRVTRVHADRIRWHSTAMYDAGHSRRNFGSSRNL